ncbi:MAG: hypothetical protein HFI45_09815 [Lachnospiraceae bacterium]|nr:hypothetical protein [Lachnospiraceae bacterium]MDE6973277.1 hypothetical protein [Lachnospiraceae bacterium]
MEKERQKTPKIEETKYHHQIPGKVLEEMTPDMKRQYFLWDEMLKRQIELYPSMLLPLIREIFGKKYPDEADVKMLSTEYVVSKVHKHGENVIEAIRSDLLIQVGIKDLYHMECQMKPGGNIAVRMLEYDMNIALVHGLEWADAGGKKHAHKYIVKFPQSALLYLDSTSKTPDQESCIIIFPDGTKFEYGIPVLKVQGYTPEMAAKKGLGLLFPYFPIRFKHKFDAIIKRMENPSKSCTAHAQMKAFQKDLTKFIDECIIIIKREEENGTLSNEAAIDIVGLIGKACDHLFHGEPELLWEVHEVMKPAIRLLSEQFKEQIANQEKQTESHILNFIRQYKKDGKTKTQTRLALQEVFSFMPSDAEEKIEKYW